MHKLIWALSGVYDGLLGLCFALFAPALFARFRVTPPNHYGYVYFPALLLVVFGLMFLHIASDPPRHRAMMPYGMGLKASYVGVVLGYHYTGGIPFMWVPFAWADAVFLVLFVWSWLTLAEPEDIRRPAHA